MICDLAETYGVFNYRELPASLVACLVSGLRADSRVGMKMNSQEVPSETKLTAMIIDQLNLLIWMQTKDGQKNRNKPRPILESIQKRYSGFDTIEEFEKERKRIIQEGGR